MAKAKPLIPLVRSGYYPSRRWIPLVRGNGYTTQDGGEEEPGIWKTVTGTLIHITDALASPMQKCEVSLEPIQDLHGQDAPYPAGGGKNICPPLSEWVDGYINGLNGSINPQTDQNYEKTSPFISILSPSEAYTFSYTFTNDSIDISQYWCCIGFYDENKTFVERYAVTYSKSATRTNSNAAYIRVSFRTFNIGNTVQAEKSPTATAYAPYSNICPITGVTGATVYDDPYYGGLINWNQLLVNGNFADGISGWQSGTRTSLSVENGILNCEIVSTSTSLSITAAIPTTILGHRYIVLGGINSPRMSRLRAMYSGVATNMPSQDITAINTWLPLTLGFDAYSSTANVLYLYLNQNGVLEDEDVVLLKNVQLYDLTQMFGAGNEPTIEEFKTMFPLDYYAYNAGIETTAGIVNGGTTTTLSVTFPNTVYGGKYEFVSGSGESKMASVDLGTLDWTLQGNRFQSNSLIDDIKTSSTDYSSFLLCSILKPDNSPITSQSKDFTIATYNKRLYALASAYADGTAFKNAMNGQTLVYELATPTEIQLTPQPISTLAGENNIWSNGDSVEITYKAQAE